MWADHFAAAGAGGHAARRRLRASSRTHDVVIRHVRFRPGDIGGKEVDALNVAGDSHHVLIDHVSASWAVDEVLWASGAIHDVTIQWSVIAEGLNHSVHGEGAHGYGSLVRAVGGVTLHHNLWAHNGSRNPRLGDNYGAESWPTFDVRNNVIYDYGAIASGMTGDHISVNYVGNYVRPRPSTELRAGPGGRAAREPIVLTETAAVTYFVEGNVVEGRDDLTADNSRLFKRTSAAGAEMVIVEPIL
jgi:pectate lyase